ncbi:MAG TPA: glycosyltransferase family 4 protein [Gaiellaceae bacterium]|nr:glycosyltransferase family 4 protein [Gaiellaceae bacterium]
MDGGGRLRVLHSFPHKIGADRICGIAWQQAAGAASAGADVTVYARAVARPLPANVDTRTTLERGRLRLPYPVLKRRTLHLHDAIVARILPRIAAEVDVVHVWPQGALRTLRAARALGIPTVLERPNAHTRFAYRVVQDECRRLGVELPADHEHAYNESILRLEEEEFALADFLLCPSEFVVRTFLDEGFPPDKLIRHTYGFDPEAFEPGEPSSDGGLRMLYVGVAAVRKGLHFALDAWLASPASATGTFSIAGGFVPDYEALLAPKLAHPSVRALGHRTDVPELMRSSDILVLPSIEEGYGLVCAEAMGSGCVPVVSDACTDLCRHMENALVHPAGDVATLQQHITLLERDRELLAQLRAGALASVPEATWEHAGRVLVGAYELARERGGSRPAAAVPAAAGAP